MDFYNTPELYKSYEGIREKGMELIKNLSHSHPAFTDSNKIISRVRKAERFSNLSAEERWNFSKKINDLQKIINEIQSQDQSEISNTGFSLVEVLEVLDARRAMHQDYKKA